MVAPADQSLTAEKIRKFVCKLRENDIPLRRVYLFGSHTYGAPNQDSDIDLAVFLDKDEVDRFDESVRLTRFRRGIDLRIEPHAFGRNDLRDQDPMVREIIRTGQRIV